MIVTRGLGVSDVEIVSPVLVGYGYVPTRRRRGSLVTVVSEDRTIRSIVEEVKDIVQRHKPVARASVALKTVVPFVANVSYGDVDTAWLNVLSCNPQISTDRIKAFFDGIKKRSIEIDEEEGFLLTQILMAMN